MRQLVSLSWMDGRITRCQVWVVIEAGGHYEISRQQVLGDGALVNRGCFGDIA